MRGVNQLLSSKHRFLISFLIFTIIIGLIAGSVGTANAKPLDFKEKIKNKFPNKPNKGQKLEIPEWRSAHTKHFLLDDGNFQAEISKDSIFYQDEKSKQWKDIDNNIELSGTDYINKANRFKVKIPQNAMDTNPIKFEIGNASIDFLPIAITQGMGTANGNKMSYKNAYKNTDLLYTIQSDSLKEDIVLNSADAPTSFSYELNLNNLTYNVKKDGSIDFKYADTSLFAFSIPKPFMYEDGDKPVISDQVTQKIRKSGSKLFLDINADSKWIQDPNRKFPVTIDPSVNATQNFYSDTYASSVYPTTDLSGDTHVYAGTTSTYGKTEAYIRFPLPTLPDGAKIITDGTAPSTISLYNYETTSTTNLDVYRITSWWNESSANWNSKPLKGTKELTKNVTGSGWQTFDLSNLISDWYTGRVSNNGVAFVANPDTAPDVGFTSSNHSDTNYRPKMTINYTIDPDGTNPFWTYTGDGVMPLKGNLFLTATDLSTAGRGTDAMVTRSYNSRQLTGNGVFGAGWLSNLDMKVWDMSGSVAFLDASGTRHIFDHLPNDSYAPPAGVPLSLTRDDVKAEYYVTSLDKTVFTFSMNTGKITKISNSNGQTTTFATEVATGDLIQTDASSRTTKIHFLANGKVDYATDPKGRKVQYAYDATTGMLNSVNISYGTESVTYLYTYLPTSNLLSTVKDPNGNIVTYNYDAYSRIQSVVRKLNGSNVTNTYAYDTSVNPRLVTVTGMNGEKTVYHTNDNGNVVQTDVTLNGTNTATNVYSWDAFNNLYQFDRPNSQTTKIVYGNNGIPINITTPDNKDTRNNYDGNNNPVSVKDPLNNVSGNNYDSKGNPLEIADAAGNTSLLDYATNGNLVSKTDTMSLAENLIYNSGFENSVSNQPKGWDASRTVNASDIYQTDSTTASGGFNSMHLKSADAVNGIYSAMHYQIPVTQKMAYNLSGDIKLAANTTIEFRVAWYDSSSVKIQEDTGLSISKSGTSSISWQHKATGLTAPANAVNAIVKVGVIGTGEAWFDNVIFEGGTGRSGNNLIADQSFDYDSDKSGGVADGWNTSSVSAGITMDYTMNNFKDGIASQTITGDPNNQKYVIQNLNILGSKGTKLNLSGWSKQLNTPSTGGFWGLQIQFTYTDSTNEWIGIQFDRSQTAWQQASRIISASKDFTQVAVIPTYNNMPTTAQAWFDDVRLNVVDVPSSTISKYNFADNGSFEHAYDPSTPNWPDGWVKSSGNGSYTSSWVDLASSNGNVYSGTHALKMTNPISWESVTRSNDPVPFDSSKTYSAIGYIKPMDSNSSGVLIVNALDASGNSLGQILSQAVTGPKDWTRMSIVVNSSNAPAGTAKITVGARMNAGTGTTYFDNLRLQDGDFRTQLGYDANGNYINNVTSPIGNQIMITTDANTGNVQTLQDSIGNSFSFGYNMMDQLNTMTYPYQGVLGASKVNKTYQYNYDNNGNLLSVTDPNSKTWVGLLYNELNQIKQLNEKVTLSTTTTNSWLYGYDTSGRMNKITTPTGQYAQPSYDNAGRLTGMDFGNGTNKTQSFTYGYDLNGNMTSFGTGSSNYSAQYNNMNRVTQVTEPTTANYLVNTYDDAGQKTKTSVHWGSSLWESEYGYDSNGRAKSFHDVSNNRYSYYQSDEAGRPIKVWNDNLSATYYDYDRDGRVIQLRTENAGLVVAQLRYDYDNNGNVTKVWNDIDGSWVQYTYDSLGQLLKELKSDTHYTEYQYDELGNRTKVIKDGVTTNYTYNAEKNRLITVGSNNYSYDTNGNITGDGVYTYVWGDNNKIAQVKQGSTSVASFTYDALGRRDTMTAGGINKTFHYDGDRVAYVVESSGKVYRFAYDHNGRPIFMNYSGKLYWYHYDKHGNVISMSDSSGTTVVTYAYDAWGNVTSKWGKAADANGDGSTIVDLNPFRYSGYWYDNETGKYYLNARYYDSQIGRFLSKDTINVSVGSVFGLNFYLYSNNNPVSLADHTGMIPASDDGPDQLTKDYVEKFKRNSSIYAALPKSKFAQKMAGSIVSSIQGSKIDAIASGISSKMIVSGMGKVGGLGFGMLTDYATDHQGFNATDSALDGVAGMGATWGLTEGATAVAAAAGAVLAPEVVVVIGIVGGTGVGAGQVFLDEKYHFKASYYMKKIIGLKTR
jgi:RHS repeat-associated protein